MRKLAIVFAFIRQGDSFLLQLRNGDAKIGGANKIGCFGGKVEQGEDEMAAMCRELSEETSILSTPSELKYLGVVTVISDHQLEEVEVTATVFELKIPKTLEVVAHEGKLVGLTILEAKSMLEQLTTGTKAGFEKFIFSE